MTILKETLAADGNTDAVQYPGGEGYFNAQGTFGGGTASLQMSIDNGTTYDAISADAQLTAGPGVAITLPPCKIRVNLTGSTTPSLVVQVVVY